MNCQIKKIFYVQGVQLKCEAFQTYATEPSFEIFFLTIISIESHIDAFDILK